MTNMLGGKIALITGGSSGIGLATARRFISEGASVVIVARDQAKLDSALQELGPRATAVQADVSKIANLDAIFAHIQARHGRLDIVFANAGGSKPGKLDQLTEEQFDFTFDLNVKGVFFLVQKALPLLADGGAIVLTTSIANVKGMPGASGYSASKAAVRAFARTWTTELKDRRIRVNAVSPGPIDTPLHQTIGANNPEVMKRAAAMVAQVPVGRIGQPEEVAAAVTFLASDQASFITGVELSVDGGLTAV
ncbi:SDR family NAD(P)-dependent oxidoreductase [Methylocapsa sp. S129]|uniref:SDR family NAD(P)-dependent oxidoreductase n=1 Tax=Methylocapsa sp. S129 TaxID=1641869 RepID=UPI00131DB34C|nr:glucose 1-dehydrogenase [Methylocapsa sp. S129]